MFQYQLSPIVANSDAETIPASVTADVLRAAATHIETYGHHKGALYGVASVGDHTLTSRSCALGAIAAICRTHADDTLPQSPRRISFAEFRQRRASFAAAQIAMDISARALGFVGIADLNDDAATTPERVCRLMRATAERLDPTYEADLGGGLVRAGVDTLVREIQAYAAEQAEREQRAARERAAMDAVIASELAKAATLTGVPAWMLAGTPAEPELVAA